MSSTHDNTKIEIWFFYVILICYSILITREIGQNYRRNTEYQVVSLIRHVQ